MLGIYFSGTGNSRYALERFLEQLDNTAKICSIQDDDAAKYIKSNEEIVVSYPVQYSNIPKMLRDFVEKNRALWRGKKIFVIATMGLFSGDGAGVLARLLKKYGAEIAGGLHLKMPDSIADEKALKRPLEENIELVRRAEKKIDKGVLDIKDGKIPQDGIGFWCHMAGLFGQRLYFGRKAEHYTDKVKINRDRCAGCGKCVRLCPMKNISLENRLARAGNKCTMCYRCVNICPVQAVTLLGKHVAEQGTIEKYLPH